MEKDLFGQLKTVLRTLINRSKTPHSGLAPPPRTGLRSHTQHSSPRPEIDDPNFESIAESFESKLIQSVPKTLVKQELRVVSHTPASPLWTLIKQQNVNAVKAYLQASAATSSKQRGPRSRMPLHLASANGDLGICRLLVDYSHNIDLSPRDADLQTPLHLACKRGHLAVAQFLVRSGAELNPQDAELNTPLHLATRHSHLEVVQWLLKKVPDSDLHNKNGETALQTAKDPRVAAVFNKCVTAKKRLASEFTHTSSAVRVPQLEEFDLVKLLGKGSFGEVFLVKHIHSKEQFALKVLDKKQFLEKDIVRYALTERNILTYIKHPFIVELKFALQTSDKMMLGLEYCPGGDLGAQLSLHTTFPEWLAKTYLCEVVLAIEELHKNNIIFRDLKPDNILLDSRGHIKLTDFGLSKERVQGQEMTGTFCGSAAYLAPEVIRRAGHGKSVDWYSVGVLLYEMLVGTPPYYSKNRGELLRNIQRGKLIVPKSVSASAKALLVDLLHRNPFARLGARRGAEEVKAHSFFCGVNWDQVLKKELKPVVPRPATQSLARQPLGDLLGNLKFAKEHKVEGWTFVMK